MKHTNILRLSAFALPLLFAVFCSARTDSPKIVKSDGIEMQPVTGTAPVVAPVAIEAPHVIGDVDTPPSHPACADAEGQTCLNKSSALVLAKIKETIGKPNLHLATSGENPVTITFAINQFGDMKDIKVHQIGDNTLHQKIMVALYDLPKFTPATKDRAATGATLKFTYRYADLYN